MRVPLGVALRLLACAAGSAVPELHGSGDVAPSRLFWQLMGLIEARARELIHMTYRATGPSVGQIEFVGSGAQALNHFGSGGVPMAQARYDNLSRHGRKMLHVPFALRAIGVFHSLPASELTGPLNLTGCELARIFSGEVTTWGHPSIKALNPGVYGRLLRCLPIGARD